VKKKIVVCYENDKKEKNIRREFKCFGMLGSAFYCRVKWRIFLNCLTPKIKAILSPETSLYFRPVTKHNISEDTSLQQRRFENLRIHGGHQYISQANRDLSTVKYVQQIARTIFLS